jgi:predicted membrane metal-binding protein
VEKMGRILWIILAVIIVIWLIGFLMDVAGGLIHILLIIAAIILVINLVTGRKGV